MSRKDWVCAVFVTVLLVAIVALSLTACGSSDKSYNNEPAVTTPATKPEKDDSVAHFTLSDGRVVECVVIYSEGVAVSCDWDHTR